MATSSRLLLAAGILTWVLAGVPTLTHAISTRAAIGPTLVLWALAHLGFGAAFIAHVVGKLARRSELALVALQTVAAIVAIALARGRSGGFEAVLLAIVAAELPFVLGAKQSLVWLAGQNLALGLVFAATGSAHWQTVAGFLGFQLFALGAAHLARREAEARSELAATHAELVATQALLAEASREAERMRIARELHDSVGHHLTALGLQLEIAKNTAGQKSAEAVERARSIASELLGDVRDVVKELRDARNVELESSLRALASGAPGLAVHLSVQPGLALDSETAHALFRCAQESITNTLRHARAREVWLELTERDGFVTLQVRDDGRGAEQCKPGSGLSGARERLESLGGRLELATRPGEGFLVSAQAPAVLRGAS